MNIIKKRDKKIEEVLSIFLKGNERVNIGIWSLQIEEVYRKLMGDMVAKYTEKLKLNKDGVLYIHILSSPLKSELFLQREQLKDNLNKEIGSEVIKEIRLK